MHDIFYHYLIDIYSLHALHTISLSAFTYNHTVFSNFDDQK